MTTSCQLLRNLVHRQALLLLLLMAMLLLLLLTVSMQLLPTSLARLRDTARSTIALAAAHVIKLHQGIVMVMKEGHPAILPW